MRDPVSGMTLSADPAFILVIATVVRATAAVLAPDSVRTRESTADRNLQQLDLDCDTRLENSDYGCQAEVG